MASRLQEATYSRDRKNKRLSINLQETAVEDLNNGSDVGPP
jgi:hypothetical protein